MTYWKKLSIAIDQLFNTIMGGMPDETLSARCWREKSKWYKIIDRIFWWQRKDGKGHCEQSFDHEMERKDLPEEYQCP